MCRRPPKRSLDRRRPVPLVRACSGPTARPRSLPQEELRRCLRCRRRRLRGERGVAACDRRCRSTRESRRCRCLQRVTAVAVQRSRPASVARGPGRAGDGVETEAVADQDSRVGMRQGAVGDEDRQNRSRNPTLPGLARGWRQAADPGGCRLGGRRARRFGWWSRVRPRWTLRRGEGWRSPPAREHWPARRRPDRA